MTARDRERFILGEILWEPEKLTTVRRKLRPEDFKYERHQVIFAAMLTLADNGSELDDFNLFECLERRGELEAVGGSLYLTYLTQLVISERVRRDEAEADIFWQSIQLKAEVNP